MALEPRFAVGDEVFFYEDDATRTYGTFAGYVSDGSVFVEIPETPGGPAEMASVDPDRVHPSDDPGRGRD
jgi:hypothetical protein